MTCFPYIILVSHRGGAKNSFDSTTSSARLRFIELCLHFNPTGKLHRKVAGGLNIRKSKTVLQNLVLPHVLVTGTSVDCGSNNISFRFEHVLYKLRLAIIKLFYSLAFDIIPLSFLILKFI